MSMYISLVGIDGSGKSTVLPVLVNVLAAEFGLTAVGVGDDLWGVTPEENLFQPGFKPDGVPLAARLGWACRRAAAAAAAHRRLYPPLKLAHLALQERTVHKLTAVYQPDVIISDGNLLLSAAGRAVNYADRQRDLDDSAELSRPEMILDALYAHIFADKALPPSLSGRIAGLHWMRALHKLDRCREWSLLSLPDGVIFLDVAPETALARLRAKGQGLDAHENLADLTQAQAMYGAVVKFFQKQRGAERTAVIDTTDLTVAQTISQCVEFMARRLSPRPEQKKSQGVIGRASEDISRITAVLKKAFNWRYLARYLLLHLGHGSAYELTFPFSRWGRQMLQEGYSAQIMKVIYEQQAVNWREKLFLAYPLHRAIYHRLQVLEREIKAELIQRLEHSVEGSTVRLLTAPSGYAFDLLRPLAQGVHSGWVDGRRIHVVASDLDPTGQIQGELQLQMEASNICFDFLPADMTSTATWEEFEEKGPYDMVLFVGFSCWLPKRYLVRYLKWVRQHLLRPSGVLITDCFQPGPFALSGNYVGYKANYYSATEFSHILSYCGFEPDALTWHSEPEGIIHVCLARQNATPALITSAEAVAEGRPLPKESAYCS